MIANISLYFSETEISVSQLNRADPRDRRSTQRGKLIEEAPQTLQTTLKVQTRREP